MNTTGYLPPSDWQNFDMEDALHPPLTSLSSLSPTSQLCKHIIREQLSIILLQTPVALEGIDIEGVHKMRVAFRRLRTSLKIFKPLIKRRVYKYFQANLKETGQVLGSIRDLDVLFENIEMDPQLQTAPSAKVFWQTKIGPHYQNYRRAFSQLVSSQQYQTFLAYLISFSQDPSAGIKTNAKTPETILDINGFAPPRLHEMLLEILSYATIFQTLQPYPVYHQLRKEIKRYRYALEFFSPLLAQPQTAHLIEDLISLQDHLGLLNDAVVAIDVIEDHVPELQQPPLSLSLRPFNTYYISRQQEMEHLTKTLPDTWEALLGTSPQQMLDDCFPKT